MRSYQDFAHRGIELQSAVYLGLGSVKGSSERDAPERATMRALLPQSVIRPVIRPF